MLCGSARPGKCVYDQERKKMKINIKDYSKPCSCGKEHRIDVKEIIIESGAAQKLETELKEGYLSGYSHPWILCDENTCGAAAEALKGTFALCEKLVLDPKGLHADNHAVDLVEKKLPAEVDLLLAVGSGTVHDLSRYVAFHRGIPFISVPTAASVDGFVSTVAAMTWHGMKKTLPAAAPMSVFADPDIFSKAPLRLNASGVGDLMGKYICLADWKISHLLTGEYYCEEIVRLEEKALETVGSCLKEIADGDGSACETLMYALILSGLAMQMVGNSRPASGAEHHMSHFWEMEVVNDTLDALHGEKVAVGTMYVLEKYKGIANAIRAGRCQAHAWDDREVQTVAEVFGKRGLYEGIQQENGRELLLDVDAEKLQNALPEIADILEALPDVREMNRLLSVSGCPKCAADIGLSDDLVPISLAMSPYVRRRLTFNRISKLVDIR